MAHPAGREATPRGLLTIPAAIAVSVPDGEIVTVVDSAATLQALSTNQLGALLVTGVNAVAANDTVPVFTAAQMNALGSALVAVTAPPGNTIQNDGTAMVSGPAQNGMTFYITWDSSVASAPAAFKADVKATFQFYADEFSGLTLYYNVGFGEVAGGALGSADRDRQCGRRGATRTRSHQSDDYR